MGERRYLYCQQNFRPSKFQRRQAVCGEADCPAPSAPVITAGNSPPIPNTATSAATVPGNGAPAIPITGSSTGRRIPSLTNETVKRQQIRDRKRRLRNLANNNSALDLKHSAAEVWLVGPGAADLANNNSAQAQVRVIEALPHKENKAMLDTEQINDLHRLYWSERWSIRKIERHLKMGWRTISKYLEAPAQTPARRSRSSKLDSFKDNIAEWLEKDPQITAAVIEQRLRGCAT